MAKRYLIDEVINSLSKKKDIVIKEMYRMNDHGQKMPIMVIKILKNNIRDKKTNKYKPNPYKSHDIGNGSWGKIEFLKGLGWRTVFVESFKHSEIKKKQLKQAA